jgi:hypothetical protein
MYTRGVKWLGHETDHSSQPDVEVKIHGPIPPLPQYAFLE